MSKPFEEPLVQVCGKENWKYLDDLMEIEWPKSATLKCYLQVRRKWEEELGIPFRVCCPEGRVENGFVCFGKVNGVLRHVILYQKLGKPWDKIFEALKTTKLIAWNPSLQFGVPHDKFEEIQEVIKHRGYYVRDRDPTKYYLLPKETALAFDTKLPEGLYFDRLNKSHVEVVFTHWPHAFKEAREYIEGLITWNFGYGVFSKADPSTPLSWCLVYECGDLGCIQTQEKYKKMGLAYKLTQDMAKMMAMRDLPTVLYIVVGNKPSENLAAKMGMKEVGDVDFPDMKPLELGSHL